MSVPTDPRLAVIFAAVAARRLIHFDYRGERRDVEPWRLDFVRGRWYVTGFDRVRAGERHFRIDRIEGAVDAGPDGAFERAAGTTGVRMQPWELGDEPPRRARLLVDADQAAWATHTIGPAAAQHPDGSVELELTVTNEAAFRSFVCGFLDHAEVLAPADLRDDMIAWLGAIAAPRPPTMTRLTAGGRLERLLSIVPWVVANDGPHLADVAARFDYPEESLLSDLTEVLFMVGIHPYTPDQLVEVIVEDGRVWIHYAEYFERPLRLTPAQALALVTAGSSLLSVPGADTDGPLARGLAKLATVLGVTPGDDVEVDLGAAPAVIMSTVRDAIEHRRQLRIEYYAYGRDELTERDVDPLRLTSDQGAWYLLAHCHRAGGERLFRLDRMRSARRPTTPSRRRRSCPTAASSRRHPEDPRVTLRLAPRRPGCPENHPVESLEVLDRRLAACRHGHHRPPLARTAAAAARAPMRPSRRSIAGLGSDPDIAATTAGRVLARYRDRSGTRVLVGWRLTCAEVSSDDLTSPEDPEWVDAIVRRALERAAAEPAAAADTDEPVAPLPPARPQQRAPTSPRSHRLTSRAAPTVDAPVLMTPEVPGQAAASGPPIARYPGSRSVGPAPRRVEAPAVPPRRRHERLRLGPVSAYPFDSDDDGDGVDEALFDDALALDETHDAVVSSRMRSFLEWGAVIVGALAVALLIKTFLMQAYLHPVVVDGDHARDQRSGAGQQAQLRRSATSVVAISWCSAVRRPNPSGEPDLIKRVIGLGGETIQFRDGDVFIRNPAAPSTSCCASRTSTRV